MIPKNPIRDGDSCTLSSWRARLPDPANPGAFREVEFVIEMVMRLVGPGEPTRPKGGLMGQMIPWADIYETGGSANVSKLPRDSKDIQMNEVFKVGDKVMLKSGGPEMTVLAIDGDDLFCRWTHEDGHVDHTAFKVTSLVPYPQKERVQVPVAGPDGSPSQFVKTSSEPDFKVGDKVVAKSGFPENIMTIVAIDGDSVFCRFDSRQHGPVNVTYKTSFIKPAGDYVEWQLPTAIHEGSRGASFTVYSGPLQDFPKWFIQEIEGLLTRLNNSLAKPQ